MILKQIKYLWNKTITFLLSLTKSTEAVNQYYLKKVKAKEAARGVTWKKLFLKISQNSHDNTYAIVSFLIKLQASGLQLYYKNETLVQVSSCEFYAIF